MTDTLCIRRAAEDDMPTIIGFIDEAAAWLRTKDTDQWATEWPSRKARDDRVLRGLRARRTWMVENHLCAPVATITIREHGNQKLWTVQEQSEKAVYVSRLIVSRSYSGDGIGAALIDWAGLRGLRGWGAEWVRIDVWSTNVALHNYYEKRGFRFCRICQLPKGEYYPSAALFQKPTSKIDEAAASRFAGPSLRLRPREPAAVAAP